MLMLTLHPAAHAARTLSVMVPPYALHVEASIPYRTAEIAACCIISDAPAPPPLRLMDTLDESLTLRLLSHMDTPRDAACLAAVNKRLRRVESTVTYGAMRVAATDAGAVAWLLARAGRVASARIDCSGAPLQALRAAHDLARAMTTGAQLDLDSQLFGDILHALSRDGPPMVTLLKQHVRARVGGATRDGVRDIRQQMHEVGYDDDYDPLRRASFVWPIGDVIYAGERDQLNVELRMDQYLDEQTCEFCLEVKRQRNRDRDRLGRTRVSRGSENTTDWWMAAAELYDEVRQFELWPVEDVDELSDSDHDEYDEEDE